MNMVKLSNKQFDVLIKLASMKTPLHGHVSPQTAFVVDDYPYGFNLRTSIRYWIEYKPKSGFRFVSQTKDPKKGIWNTPKTSTYALIAMEMYETSEGRVEYGSLTEYSDTKDVVEFVKQFPRANYSVLKVFASAKVNHLKKRISGALQWTINGERKPDTEEEIGDMRKDLEIWEGIQRKV